MRHVLRRVKPAVRIREEQELQSCHGVDQRASAGKPDRGLAVARVVLASVVRLLFLLGLKGGASARGDADLDRSSWGWSWASVWGGLLRRRRRRRRRRRVLLPCGVTGASVAALLRRPRRRRRRFGDDGGADDSFGVVLGLVILEHLPFGSGAPRLRRLRRIVGLRLGLGGFGGGVGTARTRVGVLGGVLGGLEGMHITLGRWTGGRAGVGWLVGFVVAGVGVVVVVLSGLAFTHARPASAVKGGGICAGRCGSRPLDLGLVLGLGVGRVAASAATPPTASTGGSAVWRNRCLGGGLAAASATSASALRRLW